MQVLPNQPHIPNVALVYGFRCSALRDSTITQSAIKLGNELRPESNRKCIQRNLDMDGYILVLGFRELPLMSSVNPDLCIYVYILYIYLPNNIFNHIICHLPEAGTKSYGLKSYRGCHLNKSIIFLTHMCSYNFTIFLSHLNHSPIKGSFPLYPKDENCRKNIEMTPVRKS